MAYAQIAGVGLQRAATWVITSTLVFGLWSCSVHPPYPQIESTESAIREARALCGRGDHAGSVRILTAALQREPGNSELYFLRAWSRRKDGDLAGAYGDFSQAIARDSRNADYFAFRGQVQCMRGKHADAISNYDEAIRLDSKHSRAHEGRGYARGELGDMEGAIADYSRSIELDPRNVQAIRLRASARILNFKELSPPERQRALTESMADCSRALEVRPHNPVVVGLRGQICILKASESRNKAEIRELLLQAVRDFEACVASPDLDAKRKAQAEVLLESARQLQGNVDPAD